jgi:hypothetical protein
MKESPSIFESPDKGATIYERRAGETQRELVKEDPLREQLMEATLWGEIRRMAKTNPAMKDCTDRCIELYHLLKEHK